MSRDEGVELTLPSIPYVYHDIVARIVPGVIQLGLIGALAIHHCPECVNKQSLMAVADASQVGVLLALLAASYFIGVIFEGLLYLGLVVGKPFSSFYHVAFASALESMRLEHNASGSVGDEEAARLAEEGSSILESYEPLVPHFFARATRFLAEAKMTLYSAVAMPIAVIVVGAMTGSWWPPGGWRGIMVGFLLFVFLLAASFARQRRRAVEILRCIQYLALRSEPADAKQRAGTAWQRLLAACEQGTERGARKT